MTEICFSLSHSTTFNQGNGGAPRDYMAEHSSYFVYFSLIAPYTSVLHVSCKHQQVLGCAASIGRCANYLAMPCRLTCK